jgi:cytochrome c1
VAGADKTVGPPLAGMATRAYIAGVLDNTPDNMLRWLRDPQQIKPRSAMPNLHIREKDVRDIAAYLYTLDQPAPK